MARRPRYPFGFGSRHAPLESRFYNPCEEGARCAWCLDPRQEGCPQMHCYPELCAECERGVHPRIVQAGEALDAWLQSRSMAESQFRCVIILEGIHGAGKTARLEAARAAGYDVIEERFFENTGGHPLGSADHQLHWAKEWRRRVSKVLFGHYANHVPHYPKKDGILFVDRCPFTTMVYGLTEEVRTEARTILDATLREMERAGVVAHIAFVHPDIEVVHKRIEERLTEERKTVKEADLDHMRRIHRVYNNMLEVVDWKRPYCRVVAHKLTGTGSPALDIDKVLPNWARKNPDPECPAQVFFH